MSSWPGQVSARWGEPGDEGSPWRLLLRCVWDPERPRLAVVGLNPSTASPSAGPDPTCQRWLAMARRWGFGGLDVTNLYPLRATRAADLRAGRFCIAGHEARVVGLFPPGGAELSREELQGAGLVLACWGRAPGAPRVGEEAPGLPLSKLAYLHATREGWPIHPLARLPGVRVSALSPLDWRTGRPLPGFAG